MPPGRKLRINALSLRGGGVRVEVAGLDRQVIPGHTFADCAPIVGDQFDAPVTWNGTDDIGVADGTPVCLRFRLDQAKLFWVDWA
jgi:hypothetical protein